MEIGRLAWNLGKWIAELTLPPEVVRWEWKRFRRAFVYIATEVIYRSRQRWLQFSPAHRFAGLLIDAHVQLQTQNHDSEFSQCRRRRRRTPADRCCTQTLDNTAQINFY